MGLNQPYWTKSTKTKSTKQNDWNVTNQIIQSKSFFWNLQNYIHQANSTKLYPEKPNLQKIKEKSNPSLSWAWPRSAPVWFDLFLSMTSRSYGLGYGVYYFLNFRKLLSVWLILSRILSSNHSNINLSHIQQDKGNSIYEAQFRFTIKKYNRRTGFLYEIQYHKKCNHRQKKLGPLNFGPDKIFWSKENG